MEWSQLGKVAPGDLAAARLQLHCGALILAPAAHSFLAHAEDEATPTLLWNV